MATDVKNINAGDTGNSENGRAVVFSGGRAMGMNLIQTLDSIGFNEFAISGFDTSPPGTVLEDRFDDPRYYSGDAAT